MASLMLNSLTFYTFFVQRKREIEYQNVSELIRKSLLVPANTDCRIIRTTRIISGVSRLFFIPISKYICLRKCNERESPYLTAERASYAHGQGRLISRKESNAESRSHRQVQRARRWCFRCIPYKRERRIRWALIFSPRATTRMHK